MSGPLFGAHMPTGKGLGDAVRRGRAIGCEVVQVFTSSPQQWKSKPVTDAMVVDFRAAVAETAIPYVVSHDSYLINLCAVSEEGREKSIAGLSAEMDRCGLYGIPMVVSHIGAAMDQPRDLARQLAADGIRRVLAATPSSVTLLMETTAGQGSVLNADFDELADIFERVGPTDRLGVCLDTCHVFAAGYELRTREAWAALLDTFDAKIGLARLRCLHVNDSAKPYASRKDRHAAIGEGEIGLEPFRWLVNEPRLKGIPAFLETPDADTMHAENLGRLLALRD